MRSPIRGTPARGHPEGHCTIGAHNAHTEGVPDLYGFYAPNQSSICCALSTKYSRRPTFWYRAIRGYFSDGYYAANVLDPTDTPSNW